jgi:hypothetical protein
MIFDKSVVCPVLIGHENDLQLLDHLIMQSGDLIGLPAGALLIRPCMGHIHRHLGELEITKDILRKAR